MAFFVSAIYALSAFQLLPTTLTTANTTAPATIPATAFSNVGINHANPPVLWLTPSIQ